VTLPILIREMACEEMPLVLSDWKKDLWDARPAWGRALRSEEWWALVNHVIDHVTLPSATVWMACHRNEPSVPLSWMAARDGKRLHAHARISIHQEPELAASLYKALIEYTPKWDILDAFNPFLELKRP
jgi:hypothetical protein